MLIVELAKINCSFHGCTSECLSGSSMLADLYKPVLLATTLKKLAVRKGNDSVWF